MRKRFSWTSRERPFAIRSSAAAGDRLPHIADSQPLERLVASTALADNWVTAGSSAARGNKRLFNGAIDPLLTASVLHCGRRYRRRPPFRSQQRVHATACNNYRRASQSSWIVFPYQLPVSPHFLPEQTVMDDQRIGLIKKPECLHIEVAMYNGDEVPVFKTSPAKGKLEAM
jgi:hypothetical protein